MSQSKLKNINQSNLISHLRAEVGEIIETWTLMRGFYILTDPQNIKDLSSNQEFHKLVRIKKKFKEDIIQRLSELAYKGHRNVNFYVATNKLNQFKSEYEEFRAFIVDNNFKANRDEYISHKKLPLNSSDHQSEYKIPYVVILKAIAKAIILMKKIDNMHIGPTANGQWIQMRKRRYDYTLPAKAAYFALPYLRN